MHPDQIRAVAENAFETNEDTPAVFDLEPRGASNYKLLCAPKKSDPVPTVDATTVSLTRLSPAALRHSFSSHVQTSLELVWFFFFYAQVT